MPHELLSHVYHVPKGAYRVIPTTRTDQPVVVALAAGGSWVTLAGIIKKEEAAFIMSQQGVQPPYLVVSAADGVTLYSNHPLAAVLLGTTDVKIPTIPIIEQAPDAPPLSDVAAEIRALHTETRGTTSGRVYLADPTERIS